MDQPLIYAPPPQTDQRRSSNDLNELVSRIFDICCNNSGLQLMGGVFVVLIFVSSLCFTIIPVNNMGILQNNISGTIDTETSYPAGLYFWGPLYSVITFKTTAVTVEYSSGVNADRLPVKSRTGADPSDPDSGGQPITISVAFQYRFHPKGIARCYLDFGSVFAMHQRFIQLTYNQISNMAQNYIPNDFWVRRDVIASRMWQHINHTLWNDADNGAHVIQFEILRVDFAEQFEDTITQIQVAEQQKVVNEYQQQVEGVLQDIANLRAKNEAQCKNVTSNGEAVASEIVARAHKDGFHIKQQAKAEAYSQLQKSWGMTQNQMIRYFQIKSLQQQHGKVSVEIPNPTRAYHGVGHKPSKSTSQCADEY